MNRHRFDIVYAAHTGSCTFLLDADGVCRSILVAANVPAHEEPKLAARCLGAQYVASLDARSAGLLVDRPRPGAPMLFARVDERGRVTLMRTGSLTKFESRHPNEDPFSEHAGVSTSAPPFDSDAVATRRMLPADRDTDASELEATQPFRRGRDVAEDPTVEIEIDVEELTTEEYVRLPDHELLPRSPAPTPRRSDPALRVPRRAPRRNVTELPVARMPARRAR